MIVNLTHNNKNYRADLTNPIDISIPLSTKNNPTAWYVEQPTIKPVQSEGFIGSVKAGSSVNFRTIFFNPHGHGTHTECVGHINPEITSVNQQVKNFHFFALVVTVTPRKITSKTGTREIGDFIVELDMIQQLLDTHKPKALIIRTLPNSEEKLHKQYSNTNPPYICHKLMEYATNNGVEHFLIDLPSIDKERDNGELLAHKAFWNYPENPFYDKTITEFIYVKNEISDGCYLLNLQVAPFENDASPSRPVLYPLIG